MSLLPLQPIGCVWLRAGFVKRVQTQRRRGERICVDFVILITLPYTGQGVEIRAGLVNRALDYKNLFGATMPSLGEKKTHREHI